MTSPPKGPRRRMRLIALHQINTFSIYRRNLTWQYVSSGKKDWHLEPSDNLLEVTEYISCIYAISARSGLSFRGAPRLDFNFFQLASHDCDGHEKWVYPDLLTLCIREFWIPKLSEIKWWQSFLRNESIQENTMPRFTRLAWCDSYLKRPLGASWLIFEHVAVTFLWFYFLLQHSPFMFIFEFYHGCNACGVRS